MVARARQHDGADLLKAAFWDAARSYRRPQRIKRGTVRTHRVGVVAAVCAATVAAGLTLYAAVPVEWYSQSAYNEKYGFGPYENKVDGKTNAALARVLPELERFVERARGGPFSHPVDVQILPDKEFFEAYGQDDHSAASDDAVDLGFAG